MKKFGCILSIILSTILFFASCSSVPQEGKKDYIDVLESEIVM